MLSYWCPGGNRMRLGHHLKTSCIIACSFVFNVVRSPGGEVKGLTLIDSGCFEINIHIR